MTTPSNTNLVSPKQLATPRTDAEEGVRDVTGKFHKDKRGKDVESKFARILECELTALLKERDDQIEIVIGKMNITIIELQKVLKQIANVDTCCRGTPIVCSCDQHIARRALNSYKKGDSR